MDDVDGVAEVVMVMTEVAITPTRKERKDGLVIERSD